MSPRQTKAEKAIDRRVEVAYGAACSGVQIDMMDIPKVFRVGREAALAGASDDMLIVTISAYVETIRKN